MEGAEISSELLRLKYKMIQNLNLEKNSLKPSQELCGAEISSELLRLKYKKILKIA